MFIAHTPATLAYGNGTGFLRRAPLTAQVPWPRYSGVCTTGGNGKQYIFLGEGSKKTRVCLYKLEINKNYEQTA